MESSEIQLPVDKELWSFIYTTTVKSKLVDCTLPPITTASRTNRILTASVVSSHLLTLNIAPFPYESGILKRWKLLKIRKGWKRRNETVFKKREKLRRQNLLRDVTPMVVQTRWPESTNSPELLATTTTTNEPVPIAKKTKSKAAGNRIQQEQSILQSLVLFLLLGESLLTDNLDMITGVPDNNKKKGNEKTRRAPHAADWQKSSGRPCRSTTVFCPAGQQSERSLLALSLFCLLF